jgi:hypothetical protein
MGEGGGIVEGRLEIHTNSACRRRQAAEWDLRHNLLQKTSSGFAVQIVIQT